MDDEEEDWATPLTSPGGGARGRGGADRGGRQGDVPSPPRIHKDVTTIESVEGCPHSRVIVHVDIDCFYAQVEMIENPELVNKPVGIQQKWLMVTCNYVARALGVKKNCGVAEALKLCPKLILINGEDLTKYRNMSYKVTELMQKYTPLVQRMGLDDNFLDVTHLSQQPPWCHITNDSEFVGHVYGITDGTGPADCCSCGNSIHHLRIGSHIAAEIRHQLHQELGLTTCAGVAHNKLLAKLVSGEHKPNQQTVLPPQAAPRLLAPQRSIRSIPGLGHSTCARLAAMDMHTLSDLLDTPVDRLAAEFSSAQAQLMHELCRGYDPSPVVASGPPQSMSDEDSFRCCDNESDAKRRMDILLTSLLQRLHVDGRVPHTLRVAIRRATTGDRWARESRQCPLQPQLFNGFHSGAGEAVQPQLVELCVKLLRRAVDTAKPFHIRVINVCFTNLRPPNSANTTSLHKFFSPKSKCKDAHQSDITCTQSSIGNTDKKDSSDPTEKGFDTSNNNLKYSGLKDNPGNMCSRVRTHCDTSVGYSSESGSTSQCVQQYAHKRSTSVSKLDKPMELNTSLSSPSLSPSFSRLFEADDVSDLSPKLEFFSDSTRPASNKSSVICPVNYSQQLEDSTSPVFNDKIVDSPGEFVLTGIQLNSSGSMHVPGSSTAKLKHRSFFNRFEKRFEQNVQTQNKGKACNSDMLLETTLVSQPLLVTEQDTSQSDIRENCSAFSEQSTGVTSSSSGENSGPYPDISHTSVPDVDIPANIDKEVFLSLPPELQQELRTDWLSRIPSGPAPQPFKSYVHAQPKRKSSSPLIPLKTNKRKKGPVAITQFFQKQ